MLRDRLKPMTHFKRIYREQADQYERLVSREDYQENIEKALKKILPFDNLDVIDLGTGTGRLTLLLSPYVRHIVAFDISPHMLSVAKSLLEGSGHFNWDIAAADNRQLPSPPQTADLVIAGWSLGHSVGWYPDSWKQEIGRAIMEMQRVQRPGGTIIILETLGTNQEFPQAPTLELAAFHTWLEKENGFSRTWIRTDYQFVSVQEAVELTRFFFGDEMADDILSKDIHIVPECTGIWWRSENP